MSTDLSPNTQAILLVTAPLLAGHRAESEAPLTAKEYNVLASRLRELQYQPADLLTPKADEVLQECRAIVDAARVRRLLDRGFLLSQAVERWHSRAIWVVSRADAAYPQRFKQRLKEQAPPVIYGCGDGAILNTGGLAIVGSRHAEPDLLEYAGAVGRLAAQARKTVVSGGAKGIDEAAMRGGMTASGKVVGVLGDSLERAALHRQYRESLLRQGLVLISPYDPNAPFNVGHAMRRNALIYALADAALVVNSDLEKGGTWAGAIEQLERFHFVPVYVRSTGEIGEGLRALMRRGALPWPDPADAAVLESTLRAAEVGGHRGQNELPFVEPVRSEQREPAPLLFPDSSSEMSAEVATNVAGELFLKFRDLIMKILKVPMDEKDISKTLQLTEAQTREWLERLILEGVVRRSAKSRYEITA